MTHIKILVKKVLKEIHFQFKSVSSLFSLLNLFYKYFIKSVKDYLRSRAYAYCKLFDSIPKQPAARIITTPAKLESFLSCFIFPVALIVYITESLFAPR